MTLANSFSYLFTLIKTLKHNPKVHDSRGLDHGFQFPSTTWMVYSYNSTALHKGSRRESVCLCVSLLLFWLLLSLSFQSALHTNM